MGTPGEFVELAIIEGNQIDLQSETLENVFEHPDVRDCQVAVYSVFGKPSTKKTAFVGKMLQYLLNKNGDVLDDISSKKILRFGSRKGLNRPSIVTWSKPFFISKGSQKVAIFLLDIKGTFTDSYDKNYIMLSGLCTVMSSSILYVSGGQPEEFLKHIERISVEGMRHFSKGQSTIHQKMTVLMPGLNTTDEIAYGDKSSKLYTQYLQSGLKNHECVRVLEAFEEFNFFFIPNVKDEMHSHFYNKLLMITLNSCYIVPKKRGGFIRVQHLVGEMTKYVDEMDPDESFSGSLKDFLKPKPPDVNQQDKITNGTDPATKPASKRSNMKKRRGSNSSKETETSSSDLDNKKSSRRKTKTEKVLPINSFEKVVEDFKLMNNDENIQSNYKEARNASALASQDDSWDETIKIESKPVLIQGKQLTGNQNLLKNEYCSGVTEKFDLQKYLNSHIQKSQDLPKQNCEPKLVAPIKTPLEILRNVSAPIEITAAIDIANGNNLESNDESFNENTLELKEPNQLEIISEVHNDIYKLNISEKEENHLKNNEDFCVELDSALKNNMNRTKLQNHILKSHNQHLSGDIKSSCPTSQALNDASCNSIETKNLPTSISLNQNPKNEKNIQVNIIFIFRKTELQSPTSADNIIENVKAYLGTPGTNIEAEIEGCRVSINDALNAILLYIEKMEEHFNQSYNYTPTDFENLHKHVYDYALSFLSPKSFLIDSVSMKINEAKRYFQTYNAKTLLQKENFLNRIISDIVAVYTQKISCPELPREDDLLRKKHEDLSTNIIKATEESCNVNKSTWSNVLLQNLQAELKRQFEQAKRIQQREKLSENIICEEINVSIRQYKYEMHRALQTSNTITEMDFDNIQNKKRTEILNRFTNVMSTKPPTIILDAYITKLEEEINLCSQALKDEFVKKCQNTNHQVEIVQNFDFEQKNNGTESSSFISKLDKAETGCMITRVTSSSRSIGVHLDFSKIVVSVFSNGDKEEIFSESEPSIGCDENVVVWQKPDSSGSWMFRIPLSSKSSVVSLKSIFERPIGVYIPVSWNGSQKFRAEELLSLFLSLIKSTSEKLLEGTIHNCAISVPSYFNEVEIQALRDAAVITGFEKFQLIRDLSSTTIGAHYFKNSSSILSRNFILVNTFSDNLDAGYFNLNKSWNPSVLSGNCFIPAQYYGFIKPSLKQRFKQIVDDVVKLSEDETIRNVLVIGDHATFEECTIQNSLIEYNFIRVEQSSTSHGTALIAALIGNDSTAESYWEKLCPIVSSVEQHGFNELITHKWETPRTRQSSTREKSGSNLKSSQITQCKKKVKHYLP